jgi:uncharacterized Rossmann fold enzyme
MLKRRTKIVLILMSQMGDGDRAVVLAGDAGACRDVRLPGSDFLKSALRRTAFGTALGAI